MPALNYGSYAGLGETLPLRQTFFREQLADARAFVIIDGAVFIHQVYGNNLFFRMV